MDSVVEAPLMLPQRTTLPPEDTSTATVEVLEQHAPIASTSKTVYQDTIMSDPASRSSPVPQNQSPGVHRPDQDMDSSVNGVSSQRARSRSTSTSDQPRASYKGKERAADESPHSPVLSQHASLLHLPDPFQVSEMERLKVENDLLRKQFAVLAKKARVQALTHSTSHATGNSVCRYLERPVSFRSLLFRLTLRPVNRLPP